MLKILTRLIVNGTVVALAGSSTLPCAFAGQAPAASDSIPIPQLFAPGVVSGPANDGAPTFSPEGDTLFFTRSTMHWSIILESHRAQGRWSAPRIAPFSGKWSDSSPAFSPDGSYLIFVSVRPVDSVVASAASVKAPAQMASHIWRVNRIGSEWSEPQELPAAVNCFQWIFRPSLAGDGSIYFTASKPGKNLSLFRSRYRDGAFSVAEPLTFSDGSVKDVDPEIAPDQSFLIFSSKRPFLGDEQHEHLFIAFNRPDGWSDIQPIRYAGDGANGSSDDNDPRLGPDRHSIYFSSDRASPVHLPRDPAQAAKDLERLEEWDNSNSNVWFFDLPLLQTLEAFAVPKAGRPSASTERTQFDFRAPNVSAEN